MRLTYTPPEPPSDPRNPVATSAYQQLAARRHPLPLQALDLTLLHSPPIASGWSAFFGAIRTSGTLPSNIRELCICRVAVLNGAAYEWEQHISLLKNCEDGRKLGARGLRELKEGTRTHIVEGQNGRAPHEEVDDGGLYYTDDEGRICFLPDVEEDPRSPVREVATSNGRKQEDEEEEGEGLSEQQWAVMAYTDAMTRDVKVPDAVFMELRKWFNEREIVEITATIAAYNCVSRFLVALDVGEMNNAAEQTTQTTTATSVGDSS
ncbi:MAG: hypothetical protein LQ343_005598 [Gyalolechia ehrenbergii]|nr:MAG: hypothetical protein LQ343_005598 [Gyalolechia ehrenbergii]